jgi:hypothetical protein
VTETVTPTKTATLHVFTDGDAEWYVAADRDDALAAQREFTGLAREDQEPEGWHQLDDGAELGIWLDEERQKDKRTQSCRAWADERGRGFLCTTEF